MSIMPEFTLVNLRLVLFYQAFISLVVWCYSLAAQPPQWLMALAVAIIRGLHITNTIKSL